MQRIRAYTPNTNQVNDQLTVVDIASVAGAHISTLALAGSTFCSLINCSDLFFTGTTELNSILMVFLYCTVLLPWHWLAPQRVVHCKFSQSTHCH